MLWRKVTCFNGYPWLVQAPNILNQYENDLFLAVNETLKTFLNIWMSIWVFMLPYSLYTQFLVSKHTSKQKNKQNNTLYYVNFSRFPGYSFSFSSLVIFWVHEDYPHTIILEVLCLCTVSHHHHYPVPFHVCYHHYCSQMPSVLLWFCYLWVLHLLKYVLILYRNGILFSDRQISHKNEMSGFV